VIENMSWFVAPDTGVRYEVFSGGGGQTLADELGVPLLGQIPLEPAVAQCGDAGLPVVAAHPESPAARALLETAERVVAAVRAPALTGS
jgi:ATP-binding protein involved in chromosome partitioning